MAGRSRSQSSKRAARGYEEFTEARHLVLQVRKPRQRAVLSWELATWSLSDSWVVERLEGFIRHHAS